MKHVGHSILHFVLFSVLVCVHRWLGVFELERIEVESFPGEQVLTIIAVVGVGLGELAAIGITGRRGKTAIRVTATLIGLVLLVLAAWFYEHLRSKLDFPDPASMHLLTVLAVVAFGVCYFAFGLMMEGFLSLFLHRGGNHPDAG